jgi:zinc protease
MKSPICFIVFYLLLATHLLAQESGKLKNGLEYHLMHNEAPRGSASIRLVLKLGMIHENENQKGFAHLVEHLCCCKAQSIAYQQIENELGFVGMTEESAPISSLTHTHSTVFKMNILLDQPEALRRALVVLKEMTRSASLLPDVIDNEKKEVLEELINTMADPLLEKFEKQTKRLLGRKVKFISEEMIESVHNASLQQLQSFYHLNYRPDQMALIVIGDFDENSVKRNIADLFGPLLNPQTEEIDEEENLYLKTEPSFLVHENQDAILPQLSVAYLFPQKLKGGEEELRFLIEQRLHRLVEQKVALSTWSHQISISHAYQLVEIGVVLSDETSILSAAERFMNEISRMEQSGFTEKEWMTAEEAWKAFNPLQNELYAEAYTERFLGYSSSKPLKTLLGVKELKICNNENLKSYPKVITLLIRSRDALYP